MRTLGGQLFLFALVIFLNFYTFSAIKTVTETWQPKNRTLVHIAYWSIAVLVLLCFASFWFISVDQVPRQVRSVIFSLCIAFVLSQVLASLFFLMDDLRRLSIWVLQLFGLRSTENLAVEPGKENAISRSIFLSWLGLTLGATLFGTFIYGLSNKYNYQVRRVKLNFPNVPLAFKGMKMIQISDIHSGSFTRPELLQPGVDLINRENADLIFFTGDLVNDEAREMEPFTELFGKLKAKEGIYSIFGNHDYGDYKQWKSADEKQENIESLKNVHRQLGWNLLWDDHVVLQRGDAKIGLLGVQNISGKGRFRSYGSLQKANAFREEVPFKILLSHDPSHWEAEVLKSYPDIDLTLSGHTHGMQYGVDIPGIRWSPVQWVYKYWAGLYTRGNQQLYVNRGFGFIGYPGRVGILPEITVFEFA